MIACSTQTDIVLDTAELPIVETQERGVHGSQSNEYRGAVVSHRHRVPPVVRRECTAVHYLNPIMFPFTLILLASIDRRTCVFSIAPARRPRKVTDSDEYTELPSMKAVFSLYCSLGRFPTPVPHTWIERVKVTQLPLLEKKTNFCSTCSGSSYSADVGSVGGRGTFAHRGPVDEHVHTLANAFLVMSWERN